jgi:hypothetical protein
LTLVCVKRMVPANCVEKKAKREWPQEYMKTGGLTVLMAQVAEHQISPRMLIVPVSL